VAKQKPITIGMRLSSLGDAATEFQSQTGLISSLFQTHAQRHGIEPVLHFDSVPVYDARDVQRLCTVVCAVLAQQAAERQRRRSKRDD
jgi:hypothetical protein